MPKQNIETRVRVIVAIAVAIVSFLSLLTYINEPFFDSDEGDIFSVGKCIADGMLLYTEIPSQHMPVMYYISALFSLIGVTTIVGYRLCFYGLIAVIWGTMVFVYGKEFGWVRVALYPAIYIVPKLSSKVLPDGRIVSPSMDDMFPFLPRDEYESNHYCGE